MRVVFSAGAVVLALVLLCTTGKSQDDGARKLLRVERLELVAPDGAVRGVIAVGEDGTAQFSLTDGKPGGAVVNILVTKDGDIGLLMSKPGVKGLYAGVGQDDTVSILLRGRENVPQAGMVIEPTGNAAISLKGLPGQGEMEIGGGPKKTFGLKARVAEGGARMFLGVDPRSGEDTPKGSCRHCLLFADESGRVRHRVP